ncbi:MAG: SAM-dependent methyltransferase [Candidatus Binatia bacterium]|nr:SAM-dependent methyltransferase [Candidatus Binatia bacterium]
MKVKLCGFLLMAAAALLTASCALVEDITKDWTNGEASFIPTPMEVVDRMLEIAHVTKEDIPYDLGSRDGRIVIRTAKRYGARGVGIEIDPKLVKQSREKDKEEGISHLVEFRVQDAMTVDVSPATVVTLYLTPDFNAKMRPIPQRSLRQGARVVSHDHRTEGWTPDKTETVPGGLLHQHRIYLWTIREHSR